MEILKFINFEIEFDGTKYSKSVRIRATLISLIGIISAFIITFAVGIHMMPESNENILKITFWALVILAIFATVIGLSFFIYYKITPKYFDTIIWLRKLKEEDLELGMFNETIRVYNNKVNQFTSVSGLFNRNIDLIKDDNLDRNKPIYGTVKVTDDKITLIIENK